MILFIISATLLILAFLIKAGALQLLLRFFHSHIRYLLVLKALILYEIVVLVVYLLIPDGTSSFLLMILPLIILYGVFTFIAQKFLNITWQRSIVVFLLLFLLITPILSFSSAYTGSLLIENIPVAQKELAKINISTVQILLGDVELPLPLRMVSFIEASILEREFLGAIQGFLFIL